MVFLCNNKFEGELELPQNIPPYPYPLSDFQKYAIDGIMKGHHVLVTAHTGSGKTLPAEFAINYFTNKNKKVIYTSPIKALSNQKFYEFTKKYPHISFGLLTGDIKANPTADVLIMTTEILMNSLFSSSSNTSSETSPLSFQMDIENDLGCVVFDEVHYINDADRGQNWEQTILMLPRHIQMVMLSATIDNPTGFAEWIENRAPLLNGLQNIMEEDVKKVYLASTNHRVVPLTHYGYFATTETPFKTIKDKAVQQQIRDSTNKLVLLRTSAGEFKDAGYHEVNKMINLFDKHQMYMKRKFVLNHLVGHLKQNEMLPAIVFVFSRKSVEQCAKDITTNLLEDDSKIPYIVRNECEQIIRRFSNYREYLELSEYNDLVALLEKGVGIHHSGMIPVLREIVELMISKKYIKVLFATESFAIGLDCPIKTAVFSALTKFDGSSMRHLLPHEYTQMAGRAGRRGIDTVGHVVHCNNLFDIPSINEYKQILCGKPQKLVSKFKISYPLIFRLFRSPSEKFSQGNPEENPEENIKIKSGLVKQSMLQRELDDYIKSGSKELEDKCIILDKKKESIVFLRTPPEICQEVMNIKENFSMYSAKKQKEYNRRIQDIKSDHKTFEEDLKKHVEINELQMDIDSSKKNLEYNEKYAEIQIGHFVEILTEAGFIENGELTLYGKIAGQIHEIYPMIGADLIRYTGFTSYTATQIAIMLSIFTDIRVPEESRAQRPVLPSNNPDMLKLLDDFKALDKATAFYMDKEQQLQLPATDFEYMYDLVPLISQWCKATTEAECKWFIQGPLAECEISVGDFTKAILKIVVIAKEFQTVAETIDNLSFLTALKEVEPLLLKYVATNQSLYV
jgi:superfamily II RNA helicase